MKKTVNIIAFILLAALLLTGCSMRTVDEMYCLPKRSERYGDLQSAIDSAMSGLQYCAPLSGENQQTVQTADLDGDGVGEYLVFAKGSSERPLRILIFRELDEGIVLMDTIESNGTAFDLVEYVQMDGISGMEIVVGSQLSDQVLRSVSVYSFSEEKSQQLVSANYTKFLVLDMDADNLTELFVMRPGQTDTDRGVAELYGIENGLMERSNEVSLSEPVDKLKRVVTGQLFDGVAAVYAASAVEETALITDVFSYKGGLLQNVSLSTESGTSVKTLRNYYVYADDIDNDGMVELPSLINMKPLEEDKASGQNHVIGWYAMRSDGEQVVKLYTYHNFMDGWYLILSSSWASRLTVQRSGNDYVFLIWDETYTDAQPVFTIYPLTGQEREEESAGNDRFVLLRTESVVYSATLDAQAERFGITQEQMMRAFYLIQQDWKTGEA